VLAGVYYAEDTGPLQFHVQCFWIWDSEVLLLPSAVSECAYCRRAITPDQDKATVQDGAYHSACWDEKIRRR
jgi:hypothetical protein